MEDTESAEERRDVVHSKKKLNQTQRNVIVGVVTVAGLGVVGKLLSVLQQEKPTLQKDEDVETLDSFVKEGKTRNLPLQAQVQRTKLANLDNDEPDHEVVNRKRDPNRSKYADSFSEIVSDDDITEDGEIYVSQDPVGHRDKSLNPKPRETRHHARHDSGSLKSRKGKKQLSVSEGGGFVNIKGMSHSKTAENGGKDHEEEDEDEDHQERASNSSTSRAR